jgi:hypothetical protein
MYRYAVAVSFLCTARAPGRTYMKPLPVGPQLQVYVVNAETEADAEFAGTQYADGFCNVLACSNGADIQQVKAVQIPA